MERKVNKMGEIHVRDREEYSGEEIESLEIWSDYGRDHEVIIKLKNGEVRTLTCS